MGLPNACFKSRRQSFLVGLVASAVENIGWANVEVKKQGDGSRMSDVFGVRGVRAQGTDIDKNKVQYPLYSLLFQKS
jgi:hypothetical protein